MSALALVVGWQLGSWGFGATVVGVLAAWAYSAPPVRLKRSGWWGPGLVGLSYETLPWITGAAVALAAGPRFEILAVALLYGLGAHGIMTINDFKAIEGDRRMGIRSLPAVYGPADAARMAATVMGLAPAVVIPLLLIWGAPWHALAVLALLIVQFRATARWMTDPMKLAPWFNGAGVGPYVLGMMIAAHAIGGLS
jgi:chlorophyll synthase